MDELIKQLDIRGLSWRSLLLAGALPALMLLLCLRWYDSGWRGCQNLILTLVHIKTQWESISYFLALFVVLSALFLTLRASIFAFYRRLPVPILHSRSLRRFALKRRRADTVKERSLWMITVARWHETAFDPKTFVVDAVRASETVPLEADVQPASALLREQVASPAKFRFWKLIQLQETLGKLHLLAANRHAVTARARDIAARSSYQGESWNWSQAELELGFTAPDEWVLQELTEWRRLCQTNDRAKTRIASLNRDALYDKYSRAYRIAQQFPPAEWIEATALGNTMAALEDYSTRRYGVDTSLLWSRVEKVMPSSQRDEVYSTQVGVYALLNCAAALSIAEVACLIQSLAHPSRIAQNWLSHVTVLIAAFLLVWALLRFAVYAAGQLRFQMESKVDLYVPRLLAALGLVPKDVEERRSMIAALGQFINGAQIKMPNFALQAITDPVLSFDKGK